MALGAQRWNVTRMILGESLILVTIGVGIGLATAFAAGRLIWNLLFGLAPTDGLTVIVHTLMMILVSAFAGLPAGEARFEIGSDGRAAVRATMAFINHDTLYPSAFS